jgi:uncharacterized protein (TIGR02598 family)
MMPIVFWTSRRRAHYCHLRYSEAFSLVEVVVALGIATFGILVIAALLPVGIKSTKDSVEETKAINVMSEVIADRRATPYNQLSSVYQLPALTNMMAPVTNSFGVTSDDVLTAQFNQARYRVAYVVTPPASGSFNPYEVWLMVSWPAPTTNASGSVEGIVSFPQP